MQQYRTATPHAEMVPRSPPQTGSQRHLAQVHIHSSTRPQRHKQRWRHDRHRRPRQDVASVGAGMHSGFGDIRDVCSTGRYEKTEHKPAPGGTRRGGRHHQTDGCDPAARSHPPSLLPHEWRVGVTATVSVTAVNLGSQQPHRARQLLELLVRSILDCSGGVGAPAASTKVITGTQPGDEMSHSRPCLRGVRPSIRSEKSSGGGAMPPPGASPDARSDATGGRTAGGRQMPKSRCQASGSTRR